MERGITECALRRGNTDLKMGDNRKTIYIKQFSEISLKDISLVGGKNASLGEMVKNLVPKGINIPDGFAVTASAYWEFIYRNKIKEAIAELLLSLDRKNYSNLNEVGRKLREVIMRSSMPDELVQEIVIAYRALCKKHGPVLDVAVRSSATAEDLPSASFAGQHDSFLNVRGEMRLLVAVQQCFASLFNDRAIKYREDKGFDHMQIGLSVGVQKMVRSDMACSGIGFTLDPESGFRNVIHLAGTWGLGENIVQGAVNPDEFFVFKTSLINGKKSILNKKLGTKAKTLIYSERTDHQPQISTSNIDTPEEKRCVFVLSDAEVTALSQWALIIENHYKTPMDFEWAKDGVTHEMYIVQARPETVHSIKNPFVIKEYILKKKGKVLAKGSSVGNKIASGIARIISSPADSGKLKLGEILVAENTNPDWNPIFKKAGAIITDKGGRTSHASIVAREMGIVAVVGTENATKMIHDGQEITVACQEGKTCFVYDGLLEWEEKEIDFQNIKMPRTSPMLILGDPDKAFQLSFYPNQGIGLMRLEFIISNSIRIHPMALVNYDKLKDRKAKNEIDQITTGYYDKKKYFIDKLSQSVATIAAAFYPKDVIVRMSDFKTNEYANLIGGKEFEEAEENPMIGFRGASRYYNERYKEGFRLECEAMKVVREEMGLTNVKLMIPFCRTVEEGRKVVQLMEEFGLKRKENSLEIYMMVEIPSNVILADEFAKVFDGFSIGSNDLTQLTLGIDRDNSVISNLFSEQNAAVTTLISSVIASAKKNGVKIGLCGQAPSDYPEFAQFLVKEKIDSISFNPDALLRGIENINKAENLTITNQ
jgi:pyruvate,water dikinase